MNADDKRIMNLLQEVESELFYKSCHSRSDADRELHRMAKSLLIQFAESARGGKES
ncbi:MAG: hypothetical protein LUE89_11280 [Clostridiales bacterium]|nr:hypothetical protein [Clostridiales bacterium]